MKKLFLLSLSVLALGACKKDSENSPSKTELLTAKNWRISAFTSTRTVTGTNAATVTSDEYASMNACEKDNFNKFNTDKTMVQDEGPTKCSPSAAQKENYTWDFNGDQTKLLITPAGGGSSSTSVSDIVELSANKLRVRSSDTYTAGSSTITTVDDVTFTAF